MLRDGRIQDRDDIPDIGNYVVDGCSTLVGEFNDQLRPQESRMSRRCWVKELGRRPCYEIAAYLIESAIVYELCVFRLAAAIP
ncbi:hypothetical protein J6590_070638 [Homalodisca vitripennis]|nr:hypothetical protein J6590_070638 [Homalodisca vitripennis]